MDTPSRAQCLSILGCCLVALLSGLPNGFNNISDDLKRDLHTSSLYASVLTGVGVAGLQFTLLGGLVLDRIGPARTIGAAGLVLIAGQVTMSVARSRALAFLAYTLVGFASGATFISSLGAAISLGRPIGIGLVSLSMSLSMSVAVTVTNIYAVNVCEAKEDASCWRQYMRLYAMMCAVAFAAGIALLVCFLDQARKDTALDQEALLDEADDEEEGEEEEGGEGKVEGGRPGAHVAHEGSGGGKATAPATASVPAAPAVDGGRNARLLDHAGASEDAVYHSFTGGEWPARDRQLRVKSAGFALEADKDRRWSPGGSGPRRASFAGGRARRTSTNLGPEEAHHATHVLRRFLTSTRVFGDCFFWCLFLGDLFGVGCGIFVVTNVNQLWASFAGDDTYRWTNAIVVGFSVSNAVGNLGSPLLSDWLFSRGIMSRAKYLAYTLLLFAADFLAIALVVAAHSGGAAPPSTPAKVLFAALLSAVGLGFGTFLVLLPTSVSDAYGVENFGTFLSYMQLGVACFAVAVPAVTTTLYAAHHSYLATYYGFAGGLLLTGACMLSGTAHQPEHMRLVNEKSISEEDAIVSHQMW